ncbi:O-antigen polymerase [Microbacterium sp. NPDC056057]|uniref:O-antigen polymerase n=1 Tax=Microbacterium sp. NPDC056057 TaxID=3345699 RepID=UPI0035D8CEF1
MTKLTQSGPVASTSLYIGATFVCIAAWSMFVAATPSTAGYLGLAIVLTSLLSLAADSRSGRLGPLSLTFWAFVAVWAGIAPLYQLSAGHLPWRDVPAGDLHAPAQLLTLVAALAYRIGQTVSRSRTADAPENSPLRPRILLGGVLLPILAFPLAALSGVSLASRFQSRDDLIEAYAAQGLEYGSSGGAMLGILKTLPICIAAVGVYVVVNEIRRRRRAGERVGLPLLLALLVSLAAAATFANPLSNSRFQAFSAILMVIFALATFRTTFARVCLSAGMVLGLLVAYPLSAAFKNTAIATRLNFQLETFASVDFDGFQQTVNSLWYVEQHGHTLGYHLLSALGFFIPRSVWEDKALPASFPVAESRGYVFQNLALPLWSEMYVEFGVIGMLLVFFIIGLYSRKADLAFVSGAATRLAMVTPVLAAVQIGVLRGPLGAQIVFAATCVALTAVLYRKQGKTQSSSQDFVHFRAVHAYRDTR